MSLVNWKHDLGYLLALIVKIGRNSKFFVLNVVTVTYTHLSYQYFLISLFFFKLLHLIVWTVLKILIKLIQCALFDTDVDNLKLFYILKPLQIKL